MVQDSHRPQKTILVVDDTTMSRMSTVFLLHEMGYATVEADSGAAALQILAGKKFDAVLMDYQMPEMNGIQCTEMIRSSRDGVDPLVPIIALTTGTGEAELETRCILAGMNGFLLKSTAASELREMLTRLIK